MTTSTLWAAAVIGITACGPNIYTTQIATGYPSRPDHAEVAVFSVKIPSCEFEELGLITMRRGEFGTDAPVLDALKHAARKMGADAVVALREAAPVADQVRRGLTATAIRFSNAECRT